MSRLSLSRVAPHIKGLLASPVDSATATTEYRGLVAQIYQAKRRASVPNSAPGWRRFQERLSVAEDRFSELCGKLAGLAIGVVTVTLLGLVVVLVAAGVWISHRISTSITVPMKTFSDAADIDRQGETRVTTWYLRVARGLVSWRCHSSP